MIDLPFSLLAPYKDVIDVKLFTREDHLSDDASIERALGTDQFAVLKQVHGNRIAVVRGPQRRTEEADGAATDVKGLWLCVRIADCQPLIAYAPKQHMVGVIHAGWRGVRDGIIPAFFKKISDEWRIAPRDAFVCAGPSLCIQCAGFTDPSTELSTVDPRFFHGRFVDLRGAADDQLETLGVPASHRQRSPDCTRCENDTYWSYRGTDHDAVKDGFTNILAIRMS